jgi:hypothetical protein
MSDLIKQARAFATQAHQRIGHRRKYTKQPYEVHLKAVAQTVSSVTDDAEMIAAAWLHDTVEDTSATHHDIEQTFGKQIARLVYELTDTSKPSDGNRAMRKALDRQHLAQASVRTKTIKLADIIDNSRDICTHDPEFSRVYLNEAALLLQVLDQGDASLLKRAQKELARCADKLGMAQVPGSVLALDTLPYAKAFGFSQRRVHRLFTEAFTAKDIAEPIHSFDSDRKSHEVESSMHALDINVIGVRRHGQVIGYAWKGDLDSGQCGDRARAFGRDQVVYGDASLSEVILVLTRYDHCFITLLGTVAGVVTRADMEKPIVRMWLFGMITMLEINLANRIRERWPGDEWHERCSNNRLRKAQALGAERSRLNQHSDLIDCLQLSDKAQILLSDQEIMEEYGFSSKTAADRTIKEMSSLRNNLAHGQSIVSYDWPQIVLMTQRLEESRV